jgi:hypothetical protein
MIKDMPFPEVSPEVINNCYHHPGLVQIADRVCMCLVDTAE